MNWPPPPTWVQTTAYVPADPRYTMPTGYPHPSPPWYNQQLPPQQPDPYRANTSPAGTPFQSPYLGGPNANNPQATAHRSVKYPSLNPTLAEDTTILRYDLKQKPSTSIMPSIYFTYRATPVLATAAHRMRIVCKDFPWQIDISAQGNVTCGDVWEAMYAALQEPIADSEWGFIITQDKRKAAIEKAVKKRLDADPMGDKRPKRIDYLGDTTLFRGLERDEEYAKLRQLPHGATSGETWMLKLIS